MTIHLISKVEFALSVGMLASGIAVLLFVSSGFSGTAEFQSDTAAIIPNGLVPGFIVGLLLLAFGAVEFFSSVTH
jgi:hypothetical protein